MGLIHYRITRKQLLTVLGITVFFILAQTGLGEWLIGIGLVVVMWLGLIGR
jgi:hypothetical protein